MVNCFLRNVVTFVEHVNGLFLRGKNNTASQRQVRQYDVMIGDNHIHRIQQSASEEERTTVIVWATLFRALTANGINPAPHRLTDLIRIGITLSRPVTTSKGLADILHIIADVAIGIHFAFHMNVAAHLAEVPATALRHRIGEAQARSRLNFWQILGDDLFLKRNSCRGDDQRLMLFHRQRDQRQTIPECFPCPRTCLNNPDAILLFRWGRIHDLAAKRHHVYLPGTRG